MASVIQAVRKPDCMIACPSIDFAKNIESVTFLEDKHESKTILERVRSCGERSDESKDNNESSCVRLCKMM